MLMAAVAAAGAFAATNIDDIFVLMLFFSQVGAGGLRRLWSSAKISLATAAAGFPSARTGALTLLCDRYI